MANETQLEVARQEGIAAKLAGVSRNPYSQESGRLWHVANQDELYRAWEYGRKSRAI